MCVHPPSLHALIPRGHRQVIRQLLHGCFACKEYAEIHRLSHIVIQPKQTKEPETLVINNSSCSSRVPYNKCKAYVRRHEVI